MINKNIYILPTDKPSKLFISSKDNELKLIGHTKDFVGLSQNIYITSDEEVKEENWIVDTNDANFIFKVTKEYIEDNKHFDWSKYFKKIILTTDQDLIKDGVQAIDDEFLEWFVKNPSCEFAEVEEVECKGHCWKFIESDYEDTCTSGCEQIEYKIIIPKEEPIVGYVKSETKLLGVEFTLKDGSKQFVPKQEVTGIDDNRPKPDFCYAIEQGYNKTDCVFPACHCGLSVKERGITITHVGKQETLEEAKQRLYPHIEGEEILNTQNSEGRVDFEKGAKWQAERMYGEEDLRKAFEAGEFSKEDEINGDGETTFNEWFEQFKKK
jgi:hypothetical protein